MTTRSGTPPPTPWEVPAPGNGSFTIEVGALQFASPTVVVAEDAGFATIIVVRTGFTRRPLTVSYSTSDGSATAGADYGATSGLLTFGPGETTRSFTVPIRDDLRIEANETIILTLSGPQAGATLGSPSTAVLTIVDDDSLVVTTTADTGRGSLRRAFQTSNDPGNPILGTITFAIPGAGVQTIRPLSALPAIARPVIVDATTQPGFAGTPVVELDGSGAGAIPMA
jgi:hypothetical protein